MNYKTIIKKIKNKRIFITGNSGFVGSWLTLTLDYFDTKILAYTLKKKDKHNFWWYYKYKYLPKKNKEL